MSIKEGDLNGEFRDHDGPSYPRNAFAEMLFYPVGRYLPLSYRRSITHEDTYKLRHSQASINIWARFEPHWRVEMAKSRKTGKRPNLLLALVKTLWFPGSIFVLIFCVWAGLQYTTPLLIPYLAQYFVFRELPAWWGYSYMASMLVASLCSTILFNVSMYLCWTIGVKVRSILINLIYRKSLTVSSACLGSRGQVLNLMSYDAQIILDTFPNFMMGLISPIQMGVTFGLMAREIGVFCLIPLGVLLLSIPLIASFGKFLPSTHYKVQRAADQRIKLTTEFISAIRIVKYYAWERPFLSKIDKARENEIKQLVKVNSVNAVMQAALISLPTLALGWTVFFYSIGHSFALGNIFAAIAYLAYLRFPFVFLPLAFAFGSQYVIALRRISEFCLGRDIDPSLGEIDPDPRHRGGMKISKNAKFSWDTDPARRRDGIDLPIVLKDINVKVRPGQLVVVVGSVGCGKSSLASAFLKELVPVEPPSSLDSSLQSSTNDVGKGNPYVWVSSTIGYASQEPFLINTTIRDNITFGQPYNPLWYQEVINSCALVRDFKEFPAGDLTEIAEKGSNLSGGQRQRVNVARAMYSNRDLFIFDDPFSAVDAHVGDHMFKNVCLPLRERGKGILLITNQLQFLPYADKIVALHQGTIAEQGKYDHLISTKGGPLYNLAVEYGLIHDEETRKKLGLSSSVHVRRSQMLKKSNPAESSSPRILLSPNQSTSSTLLMSTDNMQPKDERLKKSMGARGGEKSVGDKNLMVEALTVRQMDERDEKHRELGAKIMAERLQKKAVAHAVYKFYFLNGGIVFWILIVIFSGIRAAFSVGQNVWVSRWANPETSSQFSQATYRGAYVGLFMAEVVAACIVATIFAFFATAASRNIHRFLLNSIAHATTAFFDTTPLGRLLSRFSKDMSLVDLMLPLQLQQATNVGFLVLAVIINILIASPYCVIILAVAMLYYITIFTLYRRTAIQLQRLEAISRAPIFTHFGETLEGLSTVRAFQMQYNFTVAIMNKVDANACDFLTLRRSTQWFNMVSNLVVTIIVGGVFLMFVLFRNFAPQAYDVSLAVSAAANSVTLVTLLGAFSFIYMEFEARMNAPERILEYKSVEQERAYEIPENKPSSPSWPDRGEIVFEDLTIAYVPGVPVLHELNARINPREKVGIVGRTGAGKSTLITALFRTTEPVSGKVFIDDVDIDTLGLYDLRRRLSIIPQVPQLFMGTVRYNLDPFGSHSDDEMWHVLEMVSLKDYITQLGNGAPGDANFQPGGLDAVVEENGANFSVGQRQLLSMARCLLFNSSILLLDEATASLDVQSDALLQKMIRSHFANRTVLTIAHRLITIIDCDRVIVLDAGRIVEFDTPKRLLENEKGIFYAMVHATGKATASHLTAIANGKLKVAELLQEDPEILDESSIEVSGDDILFEIPPKPNKDIPSDKDSPVPIVEEP